MNSSSAVLITGSSSGIGAACALELDKRDFRVFAGVRSAGDAARLQQQASPRLTPVMIDVTDSASIAAAAAQLEAELAGAGLAGLVNNAGIVVCGPLELVPLDQFRQQLEVNAIGPLAVTRAVLPLLRAARGRIVNVGSINGAVSPPYLGPYSGSKHCLEALSDALRLELRPWGIGVALVEPGPVATPIWEKSAARADELAAGMPPEVLEPYKAELDVFRRFSERTAQGARSTDIVVRAIVHALTAKRPKIRYFIGWRTRFAFKIFKMVPDRIRDWIIRRQLGLP